MFLLPEDDSALIARAYSYTKSNTNTKFSFSENKVKTVYSKPFATKNRNSVSILAFEEDEVISFHGSVVLTVLYGTVLCHGAILSSAMPSLPLYSPFTQPALSIRAISVPESPKANRIEAQAKYIKADLARITKCTSEIFEDYEKKRNAFTKQENQTETVNLPNPISAIISFEEMPTKVGLESQSENTTPKFTNTFPQFIFDFHSNNQQQSVFTFDSDEIAKYKKINQQDDKYIQDDKQTKQIFSLRHFHLALNTQSYVYPDCWGLLSKELLTEQSQRLIITVLGGKGSGKSTLLRHILNSLLSKYPKVYLIDGDPGQGEISPPSVLSLAEVSKPLCGPPFSHFAAFPSDNTCDYAPILIESFFFGGVSPEVNPQRYLLAMHQLFEAFEKKSEEIEDSSNQNEKKRGRVNANTRTRVGERAPLLLNSHGWVQGMGVELILSILSFVRPSHIIQIKSNRADTNSPKEEVLAKADDFLTERISSLKGTETLTRFFSVDSELAAYFPKLETAYDPLLAPFPKQVLQPRISLSASEGRSLAISSYFLQNIRFNHFNEVPVYRVPWSRYYLQIVNHTVSHSQYFYAFNGSVVALCVFSENSVNKMCSEEVDETLPRFLEKKATSNCLRCLGLAIVQAIEKNTHSYYLRTVLSLDLVLQANVLVKGSRLETPYQPSSFAFVPTCGLVSPPYVVGDILHGDGTGAEEMKSRNNIKR